MRGAGKLKAVPPPSAPPYRVIHYHQRSESGLSSLNADISSEKQCWSILSLITFRRNRRMQRLPRRTTLTRATTNAALPAWTKPQFTRLVTDKPAREVAHG